MIFTRLPILYFIVSQKRSVFMKKTILWITFLGVFHTVGFACTDFVLKSNDNNYVVGRSLEFAMILNTQAKLFEKGQSIQSRISNNQPGIKWVSKYSYVGMFVQPGDTVIDGFNDQGFSIGVLWMPGAKYPKIDTTTSLEKTIRFTDLSSWLLGNFSTVEEAKQGLSNIHVFADNVKGFSDIPPIHLSLHDAKGKSAVIEFLNGKMHVFDNPVGVLTNAPEFPWHLTNLRNYINLSAINARTVNIDGTVLAPTGQGTGLLGLPGDWTPPSRFVRAALFTQAIQPPKDAKEAVLAAIHLLNTFDIPYGTVRGSKDGDFDFTQWIVIKDLTNKKLYVRTYTNQNIQEIDLLNNREMKSVNLSKALLKK